MRREILIVSTSLVGIIGLLLIFVPFSGSLEPSAKAKAKRSSHNISALESGEFLFEELGKKSAWDTNVLIIKDWDSKIYSYLVPVNGGKIPMPDHYWGSSHYDCKDFRPELGPDGKIKPSGEITCHDVETPEWGAKAWRWTYDGKSSTSWVPDMYSPGFEIRDETLFVNK